MTYAFGGVTLTNPPSLPLEPDGDIEDVMLRTDPKDGYSQTRPKFTRARRSWGLRWVGMGATDVANLRTYEITTLHNGADPFSWGHPITGTFTVQIMGGIKFAKRKSGVLTDVSMTLMEV